MTLQELYDKVMADEEFKKSFLEAVQDREKLDAWLKANGSEATAEQVGEFLQSRQGSGELSDDELESVAGGGMAALQIYKKEREKQNKELYGEEYQSSSSC